MNMDTTSSFRFVETFIPGDNDYLFLTTTRSNLTEANSSTNYNIGLVQNDTSTLVNAMGYVYFILTGVTSVLSIIGSLIIIITYIIFKDIRSSGRLLLVYLSIADFLTAFGNFCGIIWYIIKAEEDFLCIFHAALTIFSSISSFLWTMSIGVHLYLSVVRANPTFADALLLPFHALCWLVPAAVTIATLISGVIGYNDAMSFPTWCWIDSHVKNDILWAYLTGKGWEIGSYVITVILYTIIKLHLIRQIKQGKNLRSHVGTKARGKAGNRDVIMTANRNLTFVPLVFILSRIWGTVRFLIGAYSPEAGSSVYIMWIVPLQGVGDSVQGFANCVLFCTLTPRIRHRVCGPVFPCCKDKLKSKDSHRSAKRRNPSESGGSANEMVPNARRVSVISAASVANKRNSSGLSANCAAENVTVKSRNRTISTESSMNLIENNEKINRSPNKGHRQYEVHAACNHGFCEEEDMDNVDSLDSPSVFTISIKDVGLTPV